MYGREDIVYESAGAYNPEDYVILKSEADSVMNAYEARIKELEAENERLKAMKWISVKDSLPEDGEYILFVFDNRMFFGYYNKECEFHWCYHTGALNGATHWMQLPPPPTTEESEKEDG